MPLRMKSKDALNSTLKAQPDMMLRNQTKSHNFLKNITTKTQNETARSALQPQEESTLLNILSKELKEAKH